MKKIMVIVLLTLSSLLAFAQTNITCTMTGLVYNNLYGTYYESGNTLVGQYLIYDHYVLVFLI